MPINLKPSADWYQLNQWVQTQLSSPHSVCVFPGIHHALMELCLSMHLRFTHRRKLVVNMGFGDHLKGAELELARLGVRFKDSFDEDLKKEEKSCLAFIYDEDDLVTSEILQNEQAVDKIRSTKILRVRINHNGFRSGSLDLEALDDNEILVASLSPDYAIVVGGSKAPTPNLTVASLPWGDHRHQENLSKIFSTTRTEYHQAVSELEAQLPEEIVPWFTRDGSKRRFDRSVFVLKHHDGSAFRSLFLRDQDGTSKNSFVETTSQGRWDSDICFRQAESKDRSLEELRGLVVIDGSQISSETLPKIKEILAELNTLSSL